jgi:hypothetical protein
VGFIYDCNAFSTTEMKKDSCLARTGPLPELILYLIPEA